MREAEHIRMAHAYGKSVAKLAAEYAVTTSAISAILRYRTYRPVNLIHLELSGVQRKVLREHAEQLLEREGDVAARLLGGALLAVISWRAKDLRDLSIESEIIQ
jgi:hypothetical protein